MVKLFEIETEAENLDVRRKEFARFNAEWLSYLHNPTIYYRFLAACVKKLQPELVVELGGFTGAGTMALMTFLPFSSQLYSVDYMEDWRFVIERKHPRLKLIIKDSAEAANLIPDKIDLLFIDTDHTGVQVRRDWNAYKDKLNTKALVLFDDIHLNPEMDKFWAELEGDKFDISNWHQSGFGLLNVGGILEQG